MLQLAALHPITGPVAAPPAMLSATKKSDCSLASCPSPLPCPWEVAQLAIGSTPASRQSHWPLRSRGARRRLLRRPHSTGGARRRRAGSLRPRTAVDEKLARSSAARFSNAFLPQGRRSQFHVAVSLSPRGLNQAAAVLPSCRPRGPAEALRGDYKATANSASLELTTESAQCASDAIGHECREARSAYNGSIMRYRGLNTLINGEEWPLLLPYRLFSRRCSFSFCYFGCEDRLSGLSIRLVSVRVQRQVLGQYG
jgi:hypothetical protein